MYRNVLSFSVSLQLGYQLMSTFMRGALGFSVLRIWPIFGSVFRFSLLKIAVFRFWCFVRFADFLQFSLWFSVFVNNDGGFRILLPISFYGFSGFAKDATPRSHAKTVIPRNHLQQETMRLTVRGMQVRIHTGFHRFTELGQNFH